MEIELITKQDLQTFRHQLLEDIQKLLKPTEQPKKWLRSREVRKLLQISAGTLQNLRVNDTLHPVQLPNSRVWYYDIEEISQLLNKRHE